MLHFKSINSSVLSFLYSPTFTSIHDSWKTIAVTSWTFISEVMSLLFNMLFSMCLILAAEHPLAGECWIPPKKDTHVQGQRRSPNKTVGGVKSRLESNPIPARDTWRAQTKPCAHQETPQRLNQTCL